VATLDLAGELTALPKLLAVFEGPLRGREVEGREGRKQRKGRGRQGKGRGGKKGKEWKGR